MEHNDNEPLFNGVNGSTGDYLTPLTDDEIFAAVTGLPLNDELTESLLRERDGEKSLGPKAGVDSDKLDETGWGVIFAYEDQETVSEIKTALKPLLDLRREQAGDHYYEFEHDETNGWRGYRPHDSAGNFLARNGAAVGDPADPENVPYYLLIVGDPETIPFYFQYQLAVIYAVGRIHFETAEQYAQYAQNVVSAEQADNAVEPTATFYGPANKGDSATQQSASKLVLPLANKLRDGFSDWSIDQIIGEDATKDRLTQIMGGSATPAFIFTASHGMIFDLTDARFRDDLGAILTQAWSTSHKGKIPSSFYFGAADVDQSANLLGSILFQFACYGAGIPQYDDFAYDKHRNQFDRLQIAPKPFLSRLPQRLLVQGAVAVLAHVERAWTTAFNYRSEDGGTASGLGVFESPLSALMSGVRVGHAADYIANKHAAFATELSHTKQTVLYGGMPDKKYVARLWKAHNDARNTIIVGDPAVKLNLKTAKPDLIANTEL